MSVVCRMLSKVLANYHHAEKPRPVAGDNAQKGAVHLHCPPEELMRRINLFRAGGPHGFGDAPFAAFRGCPDVGGA